MTNLPETKIIVLKKQLDEESAENVVDKEKRRVFRSFLKKTKKGRNSCAFFKIIL